MNKSINFCHFPHNSICTNPALYCNAAYLVIYETINDHITNEDVHVSIDDRSKLNSIEDLQNKLNNIDLSRYTTVDNVNTIITQTLNNHNYISGIPSQYTTDTELSTLIAGIPTKSEVDQLLSNYYTKADTIDLIDSKVKSDIYVDRINYDNNVITLGRTDGTKLSAAVSFKQGYSSVTITVYKRSKTEPAGVVGGSYDWTHYTFDEAGLTDGWSESIEQSEDPLWMSQRVFIGNENSDKTHSGWTDPVQISGNSTTTIEKQVSASHVEVVYHPCTLNADYTTSAPSTPIGGSYNFSTNQFTVPHDPNNEYDTWFKTHTYAEYTDNSDTYQESITNEDGTITTVTKGKKKAYTWYFSIGSIGEGDSQFNWTTPAVYGIDYTQVAYNMKFIAVDYSILANYITFTSSQLNAIAEKISLTADQLSIIAKDVTITSEDDLKFVSSNIILTSDNIKNIADNVDLEQLGTYVNVDENSIAAKATNIILNSSDNLKLISDKTVEVHGDQIVLDASNKAKSNLITDQSFISLVANKVDVNANITSFNGTVQATQLAFGDSKVNQTTNKIEFVKRVIFTKNRYIGEDGSVKKYKDALTEDTPVIVILDSSENPMYVLDMTTLNNGETPTDTSVSFDYYSTFVVTDADDTIQESSSISGHQYLKLYKDTDGKLYKNLSSGVYSEPYTGYVYSITENKAIGQISSVMFHRGHHATSSDTVNCVIEYYSNYLDLDIVKKIQYISGEKQDVNRQYQIYHALSGMDKNAGIYGENVYGPCVIDQYNQSVTTEGDPFILFTTTLTENAYNLEITHSEFTNVLLNIAKLIDETHNLSNTDQSCYTSLMETLDLTGTVTKVSNSYQIFSDWVLWAWKNVQEELSSSINRTGTMVGGNSYPCPDEMYKLLQLNVAKWKNINWNENVIGTTTNLGSFFQNIDSEYTFNTNMYKIANLNYTEMLPYYGNQNTISGNIPVYKTTESRLVNDYKE